MAFASFLYQSYEEKAVRKSKNSNDSSKSKIGVDRATAKPRKISLTKEEAFERVAKTHRKSFKKLAE
ncbi:MAG: hypothetical protein ACQETE_00820 [Bacteroidota bacterium]